MNHMNSDYFVFVRELSRSFSQIGAMLPSSPFLGRAMVKPLRVCSGAPLREPRNILEAGPGTGPFTKQILRLMGPSDTFTICEINPRFLERLRRKLEANADYRRNRERVRFHLGPVQNLPVDERFDVIVSSLPFSNFPPELVQEIMAKYEQMLTEGGSITICEYVGMRKIGRLFGNPERRKRAKGVEEVLQRWYHHVNQVGEVRSEVALLNLPPAVSIELHYH